jgi:hypothetical protein
MKITNENGMEIIETLEIKDGKSYRFVKQIKDNN